MNAISKDTLPASSDWFSVLFYVVLVVVVAYIFYQKYKASQFTVLFVVLFFSVGFFYCLLVAIVSFLGGTMSIYLFLFFLCFFTWLFSYKKPLKNYYVIKVLSCTLLTFLLCNLCIVGFDINDRFSGKAVEITKKSGITTYYYKPLWTESMAVVEGVSPKYIEFPEDFPKELQNIPEEVSKIASISLIKQNEQFMTIQIHGYLENARENLSDLQRYYKKQEKNYSWLQSAKIKAIQKDSVFNEGVLDMSFEIKKNNKKET